MNEDTCNDIYAKLTKAERFEAIEILVESFNSFDEIDVFVSALDLHLNRPFSNSTADILDEDEVNGSTVHQNGQVSLSCDYCDKRFKRQASFKSHVKQIHVGEKKLLSCENSDAQLMKDDLYHDDEKEVFSCKKCVKQFHSKGSLYIHNKRVHVESGRFICNVCSKPCGSQSDLERHRRVHTGETPYMCSICPRTFNRVSHLNSHRKFIHEKEIKTNTLPVKLFPCEKCNKQFTSKGNYNRHVKRFHDDQEKELLLCQKCNKKFISKAGLYIHNKRVHEESDRFICDVCSKQCGCNSDLERHKRVHTGEKPYMCSICLKTFSWISGLNSHEKFVHEKETKVNSFPVKLFPCKKCNKQFTSKGNCNRHFKRYHDDQEKELLLCKKCDKKFISKGSLYIHNKRVHEESDRFLCDVCSRKCPSKSDLERHRRVHTTEKPYTCSICAKMFCLISTLKSHIQSVHKEKT